MVAVNNPLLGVLSAGNPDDDVIERADLPVERELEVYLRRTGSDVIGQRQTSTPRLRGDATREVLQQRQGIVIGDGQHRNLQQRL